MLRATEVPGEGTDVRAACNQPSTGGVRPAGALGPVEAFGADDLETGCAGAGFHRESASS